MREREREKGDREREGGNFSQSLLYIHSTEQGLVFLAVAASLPLCKLFGLAHSAEP